MSPFGSLWGDPLPQGGVMGEPQQTDPNRDAKLAMAAQLLAGSGYSTQRRGAGEILGQALMAGQQARMQSQQANMQRQVQRAQIGNIQSQQRQRQAEIEAAQTKLERVDLGDSIGLLDTTGRIVGRLPKSVSPDTQFGGGVTMRGQDMSTDSSRLGQQVTMRGQDIGSADAAAGRGVTMRGQDLSAATATRGQDLSSGRNRPLTEYDRKARLLFGEMTDAASQYATATGGDTSGVTSSVLSSNPVTRPLASSGYKQHEAAGLRWAQNFLYLKSGQSAPAEEVRKTFIQYLPQPGDGADVIKQKETARAQAMQNVASANNIDYAPEIPQQQSAGGFDAGVINRAGGYYNANGQ